MRCENLSSFIVMDIVRDVSKYDDAIHFEIGQPDLQPSQKVKDAIKQAVDDGKFSYTESLGLEALRIKIQRFYKNMYGVFIDLEQIILTPGTSGAFLIAYFLSLKSSHRLGLSDPSYPCYKNFSYLLDIEPVFMPIDKDCEYELDVKKLKNYNFEALQISSPSNPIGNIYDEDNFKDIIEYCDSKGIRFISDELYHGLNYDKQVHTALEFSKNAFVINGFSKYFCLPGLRLGWIIVPKKEAKKAEMMAQNLFISAPTLSQYGALEAFDCDFLLGVKEEFEERRDFLYNELKEIFEIDVKPQGAFYIWADISKYSDDSFAFAKRLLENCHVGVTPGIDFGKNGTNKYVRFSYTRDIKHMKEGIERIKKELS